jgi:NOL1/NOP2/fmu family ribosome biogenesis protein
MEKQYVLGIAFSRNGEKIVMIHKNRPDWQRAESTTFNPSKCIIFEIL